MEKADFTGKIVVITGASRGIGRAAALAFAKAGAHVVAIAKTQGALEDLDHEIGTFNGRATLIATDLTNREAMEKLGPALSARFGVVDVLIANAAILGELAPLTDLDHKTWDRTLATNLTVNWELIRQLDPLLRQSKAPRVAFMSSGIVASNRPFWGGYTVSKAGLEALAKTYAQEAASFGIKVSIINPGATRTAMRAKAMPGEDPMTLPHPDEIAPLLLAVSSPSYQGNAELFNFQEWKKAQGSG